MDGVAPCRVRYVRYIHTTFGSCHDIWSRQVSLLFDMADWLNIIGRTGHILAFDVPRELPGSSEVRCTMYVTVNLKARLVSCWVRGSAVQPSGWYNKVLETFLCQIVLLFVFAFMPPAECMALVFILHSVEPSAQEGSGRKESQDDAVAGDKEYEFTGALPCKVPAKSHFQLVLSRWLLPCCCTPAHCLAPGCFCPSCPVHPGSACSALPPE